MNVILASQSLYRRKLLSRLGLAFGVDDPRVDEDSFKSLDLPPRALAERLAYEKCRAVASRRPEAAVIGSDQLAAVGGRILGKPGTPEKALEQLRELSGKTHELVTAVTVIAGGRRLDHTDVTRLTMRTLDADTLRRYVAADRPLDCAGSYKIESLGISLFDRVETEDATAIEGLPLIALCRMLNSLGISVP
jgi:septum formation protein